MKTLNQITSAINSQIKASATQAFTIGENLELAKAHFLDKITGKQDGKAFVAWADEAFGLKKASVYNYITISKVFGSKKAFASVGIKILTKIMRDEQLVKDAEKAMADGQEINAEWVKAHTRNKGAKSEETAEQKEDGQEWDVDNVADLKKEIKRLKTENAKQAKTMAKERAISLKLIAENEALKAELDALRGGDTEASNDDAINEAFSTLNEIKDIYENAHYSDSTVYNKRGKVKASFQSQVHPDKVSYLKDDELTQAYSDFFKSL